MEKLSRRNFLILGSTSAVGLALSACSGTQSEVSNLAYNLESSLPQTNPITSLERGLSLHTLPPIADSFVKVAGYSLFELITAPLARLSRLPIGSTITEADLKLFGRANWFHTFNGFTSFPMVNEGIRYALNRITVYSPGNHWEWGIPTSALIALANNSMHVKSKNESGSISSVSEEFFPKKKVPLYQMGSNMLYWHLQRKHGFFHALGAHLFENSVVLSLGHLLKGSQKLTDNIILPIADPASVKMVSEDTLGRVLGK